MIDDLTPSNEIVQRTSAYALRIIKLYRHIQNDSVGRILGKQLLRSGTSVGANVHEAQGAQSKADFIAKMSIAHKEIWETAYWLHLLVEADIVSPARMAELQDETQQTRKNPFIYSPHKRTEPHLRTILNSSFLTLHS